jgi:hypothetical protein
MRPSFVVALALIIALALALATLSRAYAEGPTSPTLAETQLKLVDKLIALSRVDDANRPALYLRRATLCIEAARQLATQPGAEARARAWHAAAAQALVAATESQSFATYAHADEIVFFLGYELGQAGHDDAAQPWLERLVRDFPGSKRVADADAALGDAAFARHDLDAAAKLYEAAVACGPSRVYDYARARVAWCALSRGGNEALAKLSSLGSGDRAQLRLTMRRELIRALAKSRIDPTQARDYLVSIDATDADTLIDELAAAYRDAGKLEACRALARDVACD